MIVKTDAKDEKQNNNPNDPKLESMHKTRRNIKTKYYNPDPHPSRKTMYEFNDLKSQTKDLIDCITAFNRHTVCKR